jgi:hypothetical protein
MARDARMALAGGRTGAASRGSARARRVAAARRESGRLRRLVARLHGCLGTLDVGARWLLRLRAGLHGPARSAAGTARIMRVSTRREARLERLALVALQRSAGAGCAGPATVVARALGSAGTLSPSAPQLANTPPASGPSASLSAAHAERSARGGRTPDAVRRGATAVERAATGSSAPSMPIPALLALLLALAVIALPETRRRLHPPAAGSGAGAAPARDKSAKTLPLAPPIASSATVAPRRSTAPGSEGRGTGMDDTLDQMAANLVAQMRRDSPTADPQPEAEADGDNTHVDVERELLPGAPEFRQAPAPWRAGLWAREHATQAALVATVALGWLARLLRRARRRR